MENLLRKGVREAIESLYGIDQQDDLLQIQKTRKEFTGDLTLVVFPLTKISRKSPEQTAQDIGEYLIKNLVAVSGYNVIKGFLNVTISPAEWAMRLKEISGTADYGFRTPGSDAETIVIE